MNVFLNAGGGTSPNLNFLEIRDTHTDIQYILSQFTVQSRVQ